MGRHVQAANCKAGRMASDRKSERSRLARYLGSLVARKPKNNDPQDGDNLDKYHINN